MEGGEEALIQVRREKAERCRARGENPFENDLGADDRSWVSALRERATPALLEPVHELRYTPERVTEIFGADKVHVCGRLVARRGMGKASFLRLRDASGEIQLFAKQDVMGASFAVLDEIDIADHVEARGTLMVTKTGELSVAIESLRLLTKALRPLPDKWHGLTDVDQRYRRRYLDFVANPEAQAVIRARSFVVSGLRDFLDHERFVEVETPTLHTLIGGALARPFTTHHNALDLSLFLRVAPELYLKRLLVGGFERVYEIGRCYRNEGISTRHNPEFTMLEFYQAYATYETLMDVTERLFRHVDRFLEQSLERAGHAQQYQSWKSARPFELERPFARVPIRRAVETALSKAGLPADVLAKLTLLGLAPAAQAVPRNPEADAWVTVLQKSSERAGRIDWPNLRRALGHCASDGERLFVAYEYLAEPFLGEDYQTETGKSLPVFVMDHPIEVSPLARRKDGEPSVADRFELFVHGRELCNAFSELNDPDDQASRFQAQVEAKARGAEETMDYDTDYVRALEHGMPPAAGFGMGVDRLTMALTAQASIRDVIAFPLLRPEE